MSLLDVYDHHVLARGARPDDLAAERAQLLRQRLAARLVPAFGDDEHSVAVPAIGAVCERAFQLFVNGFHEPAILEAHARVTSLLRARLADGAAGLAGLARRALETGLFTPADALEVPLATLDARRDEVARRDRELAASVVGAAERGAASAGLAAVRAESPTSQRLLWGADLHDLLAATALACARVLADVARCASTSR